MATPRLILDRRVGFWSPNGWIFQCMQRNHNFVTDLTNADKKSMTPIKESWSYPQILLTKQPLHLWSLIGVSISAAPKPKFFNVCNEIIIFSKSWCMYYAKSLLFCANHRFLSWRIYRPNFWLHLPAVMRLVANDMGGVAVTRREASSIHRRADT